MTFLRTVETTGACLPDFGKRKKKEEESMILIKIHLW
jgi:hypothetical protein